MVDHFLSLRSRRACGLVAAATILVAAATASALLLALPFHQAAPAVLVGILGSLPVLALSVQALVLGNRTARRVGRPAKHWDPAKLGVHQVIGGGRLPRYVPRPHDELLAAVLDAKVSASRIVVVRGGSSTGKSRAAYQAVLGRLPKWWMDYPPTAAALQERLDGRIVARTVLWLGDLRDYAADVDGPRVLGRLADLLEARERILVVTTIWPEDWRAYTRRATRRELGGRADTVARLLTGLPELSGRRPSELDPSRGGVIDVPEEFTAAEIARAAQDGDPVVVGAIASARAAGSPGQLIQYLAGVPDLLDQYEGRGHNRYGQAMITAAMDAARFGHAGPLSDSLLRQATLGYLTDQQRTVEIGTWWENAVAYATHELKGAVRALIPIPPSGGTGVSGYKVADYLDQHGRRIRSEQLGPASLWDGLAIHAGSAADMHRLGEAARDRGLYRHAAILSTRATAAGDVSAAIALIRLLSTVNPDDVYISGRWVAAHVSLDEPQRIRWLLRELREAGADEAVDALAARAAAQTSLDEPGAIVMLIGVLREAGADQAADALAARAAAQTSLDNPWYIAKLLETLMEVRAGDALATLLARNPGGQARLRNARGVALLLKALREAGADDAATAVAVRLQASLSDPETVAHLLAELQEAWVWHEDTEERGFDLLLQELWRAGMGGAATALAARAAAQAGLINAEGIGLLLSEFQKAGAADAVAVLAARAAAKASIDDPWEVYMLLGALQTAGRPEAVAALLARNPAARVSLSNVRGVVWLLRNLQEAGAGEAVNVLAARAAAQTSIDDPGDVAQLLEAFRVTGSSDAQAALLMRDPAGNVALNRLWDVGRLLGELRESGDHDAFAALAARAAAHASVDESWHIASLLKELHEAGANEAVTALAARVASQASVDNPWDVERLLWAQRAAGADEAAAALAVRAAAQANLSDPWRVACLLSALKSAGTGEAVAALMARGPAHQVSLDDASRVALLLEELQRFRAGEAVATLAARAGAEASLSNPGHVAQLLRQLREVGAGEDFASLATRAGAQASLTGRWGIPHLLRELREEGAPAVPLAIRAANAGIYTSFTEISPDGVEKYAFGREPSGVPSLPWNWQTLVDALSQ